MGIFCPQRRVTAVIRGKITALNYDYSGSWDIPIDWLEHTGLLPFQKISLMNPSAKSLNAEPVVYTYILPTPRGSSCMNANGGIAHYFEAQGDVLIQGYGTYTNEASLKEQKPIFLDARKCAASPLSAGLAVQHVYPEWIDFVSGKLHFASVSALISSNGQAYGDLATIDSIQSKKAELSSFLYLGQPICLLSEDLASRVGFQSYEAVSLYPANGRPRFNRAMMCYVLTGLENTFVMLGDGLDRHVGVGDRMVICRYTSLEKKNIYNHKANVHVLNKFNQTERIIEYRLSDYVLPDLTWRI
jgi:aspartate 1-decarboxylase